MPPGPAADTGLNFDHLRIRRTGKHVEVTGALTVHQETATVDAEHLTNVINSA